MTPTKSMDFSVLARRKKLLFFSGLVTAILAFGISKILPVQYAAEAGMIVEAPDTGAAAAAAADTGSSVVQTQIDVLQSKGLLGRVVHDLQLKPQGLIPTMRLPPQMVASIDSMVGYAKDLYHSLNDSGPLPPPVSDDEKLVDYVQKHLLITAKQGSKLISLRFLAGSPTVAADVVNGVMNDYLGTDKTVQQDKIDRVNEYIDQQSVTMRNDIDSAQKRLASFVQNHNLPEVLGGTASALQLSKDEEALSIARNQLALRKAAFDTISKTGSIDGSEEALESQTVQALKNYEAQIRQQMGTLGPNDPRRGPLLAGLGSIQAQLKHETDLIYASISRNMQIAQAKVDTLEKAVKAGSVLSQDSSNSSVTLKQLNSELETKRAAYLAFLTQAQSLRAGAQQAANAHVLFEGVPPPRPAGNFASLSLIIGFLGGVFGAAGTLLLKDAFGTRVHTTYQLELATGLPAFGSLPDVKQLRSGGVLAARKDTVAMVTETFRSMWITMRSEQNEKGTAVVVTSSEVGEGKTMVSTAVAQRFADDGFRVLLIDADLRRPRLRAVLKHQPEVFLEQVLDGTVTVDQAIVRDTQFGFDCLLSNGRSRNPAKVLLSEPFKKLLKESKATYDFVIMDSPPVLHVADPVLLASLCEYILFVVEAGRVPGDLVAEATRRFSDDERGRMITLLTRVKPSKMDKRDYYSGYESDFERIGHDT